MNEDNKQKFFWNKYFPGFNTSLSLKVGKNYLEENKDFKPNKVVVGYPPIETSLILVLWAKKFNIPTIIDIKDNWPVNFIDPFPIILKP